MEPVDQITSVEFVEPDWDDPQCRAGYRAGYAAGVKAGADAAANELARIERDVAAMREGR